MDHANTTPYNLPPLLIVALLLCALRASAAPPERRVLRSFDFRGVTLDEGALKREFEAVRNYYLQIPNDNLLKGFRQRAGLFAPGTNMGGWYSDDVFHIFGQILSGLARMTAATGDPACKAKADRLLAEWERCIEPDGYFYYTRKPNAPHYIYDKMVGGLVDMYLYAGNRDALRCLSRITDWAIAHLDRHNLYAYNAGDGPTEWYTLSENLYRAYLATGDPKYRDFARVWEYTGYWNAYLHGGDIFARRPDGGKTDRYHAYSHVNTLGGAGAAYLVRGEPHYLETLTNAYDYLQTHECYVTGGYGPDESLLPPEALAQRLDATHATFETQCGSWAAFKMCKYLIELTGDARYGDWIERLIYNGIGASIPMTGDGRVLYYSDYNPSGAQKRNNDTGWTCCAGTRPMAVADYHDLIYFHTADSLCVNLYTPSTVRWHTGGSDVTVRQTTRFPASAATTFVVQTARPTAFALRLRAPGWLAGRVSVSLAGRAVAAQADESHWITLRRTWRDGDRVTAQFPMALRTARFQANRPSPVALLHGPVVLVLQATDGKLPQLPWQDPASALRPAPDEPLVYRIPSAPGVVVRPYGAIKEGEPYFIALDPNMRNRISFRAVRVSPNWNETGSSRFINIVGATATVEFEGTGIRWLGYRYDDGGRGEVRIDGKLVATVDQYGPGRDLPFDWHVTGLPLGKHTLTITLIAAKTPASRNRFLSFTGFEVLP